MDEQRRSKEPSGAGYDPVARVLHWSIAAMVAVQLPIGVAMTSEPLADLADPLFVLHKGLGSVLLILVVLRVVWRLIHRPPPFPESMPPLERRIASATHTALYVALLAMVVSGYVRTVGDGYPIELLDALGISPLLSGRPELAAVMLVVHQFGVFVLVALASVHVAAVLRHQLIEREPVLKRMWPPFGR